MSESKPTQDVVVECHDNGTSEARLLALLGDGRAIVRANALLALASRTPDDEPLVVRTLVGFAFGSSGDSKPLVGTMTERMMAAYALIGLDTPMSRDAALQVETMLTEGEIEALHWNVVNNPIQRRNTSPPGAVDGVSRHH